MRRWVEIQLPEPRRVAARYSGQAELPGEALLPKGSAKHGGTTKHMLSSVAMAGEFLFNFELGIMNFECTATKH